MVILPASEHDEKIDIMLVEVCTLLSARLVITVEIEELHGRCGGRNVQL